MPQSSESQIRRPESDLALQNKDTVTAAVILSNVLGPPLPKPLADLIVLKDRSVPLGHDCTRCAAVSTCSLLNKAAENNGDNPIAKRIKAINEIKMENPDFFAQANPEEREAIIKEKMTVAKPAPVEPSKPASQQNIKDRKQKNNKRITTADKKDEKPKQKKVNDTPIEKNRPVPEQIPVNLPDAKIEKIPTEPAEKIAPVQGDAPVFQPYRPVFDPKNNLKETNTKKHTAENQEKKSALGRFLPVIFVPDIFVLKRLKQKKPIRENKGIVFRQSHANKNSLFLKTGETKGSVKIPKTKPIFKNEKPAFRFDPVLHLGRFVLLGLEKIKRPLSATNPVEFITGRKQKNPTAAISYQAENAAKTEAVITYLPKQKISLPDWSGSPEKKIFDKTIRKKLIKTIIRTVSEKNILPVAIFILPVSHPDFPKRKNAIGHNNKKSLFKEKEYEPISIDEQIFFRLVSLSANVLRTIRIISFMKNEPFSNIEEKGVLFDFQFTKEEVSHVPGNISQYNDWLLIVLFIVRVLRSIGMFEIYLFSKNI